MSQATFLDNQLETYIHDMWSTEEFSALKGIGQYAEKINSEISGYKIQINNLKLSPYVTEVRMIQVLLLKLYMM